MKWGKSWNCALSWSPPELPAHTGRWRKGELRWDGCAQSLPEGSCGSLPQPPDRGCGDSAWKYLRILAVGNPGKAMTTWCVRMTTHILLISVLTTTVSPTMCWLMCEQGPVPVSFTKREGVRMEQMPAHLEWPNPTFSSPMSPRVCLSLRAILELMTFPKGHPLGVGVAVPSWF